MDYKDKVQWLRRCQQARREARVLTEQLEQLRTDATRITPLLSPAPGGGGQRDSLGRAVERIVEGQQRLQCQINCMMAAQDEVAALIGTVSNARDREILRRRYLLGQRWETIADAMHMDYRWITRRHHQAVEALLIPSGPDISPLKAPAGP